MFRNPLKLGLAFVIGTVTAGFLTQIFDLINIGVGRECKPFYLIAFPSILLMYLMISRIPLLKSQQNLKNPGIVELFIGYSLIIFTTFFVMVLSFVQCFYT